MFEWLRPMTIWLHGHPTLGVFAVFLLAFLESLAIVGTVIPGSVTLTALGVMMGTGVLPICPSLGAAILGAVLGDTLSYGIGHYYHDRIRTLWLIRDYPELLKKGELFFKKHGGKSIFLGRFIGPIRASLPLVAGTLDMPFLQFLISDIISAFIWAPAFMMPGMLIGAATLELSPEAATHLIIVLLLGLVAIWVLLWIMKHSIISVLHYSDRILARFWKYCLRHPTLASIPKKLHYDEDGGHRQLAFILIGFVSLLIFMIIALFPSLHGQALNVNRVVFHFFQNMRTPIGDQIMLAVTYLGEKSVVVVALAVLFVMMLMTRAYRLASFLAINTLGTVISIEIFKFLVKSPRPEGFELAKVSYSLPSGHASISVALIMFLTWVFGRHTSQATQFRVSFFGATLIALIACSRLYLGDHWLTDVIAGIALGAFWASLSCLVMDFVPSPAVPRGQLVFSFALAFVIAWSGYAYTHVTRDLNNHHWSFTTKVIPESSWWMQKTPDLLEPHREDRFGHDTDLLNIQWSGEEKDIVQTLKTEGWHQAQVYSLFELLRRLNSRNNMQTLPVVPDLYHYQRADLIYIKRLQADQPLLILQLWKTPHQLTPSKAPLWIGKIEYRLIWRNRWLTEHQALLSSLPRSHTVLLKDTAGWQQRTLQVLHNERLKQGAFATQDPVIILLRRK